ncbi:ATP-binding cassette sub-family A member 10-like isoform X1 [Sapajus apella]|uniref:ATP-binding cassette sub-family A member 10-like isoform X1 n=1 Tax=Sapajus apella TaxID=9515 RepID=A0A6J3EXG4_SAPAP|nr:ATP-binding cassette sub-family A member 10-like isoform X1 [Sapajus apella]
MNYNLLLILENAFTSKLLYLLSESEMLKKEYNRKPGKVEALQGIFFDIYKGQITAILGHKGAGKSTLLNILNGLSVSTEGKKIIMELDMQSIQDIITKKIKWWAEEKTNIRDCHLRRSSGFATGRTNFCIGSLFKALSVEPPEGE